MRLPMAAKSRTTLMPCGSTETLDGVADIAGGRAGLHRMPRIMASGDLDQPSALRAIGPITHAAGSLYQPSDDEGDVDIDVSPSAARSPGISHAIDRGAGRVTVTAIHQRRRIGAMAEGEVADNSSITDVGTPALTRSVSASGLCD
jgi:hypothetical protein